MDGSLAAVRAANQLLHRPRGLSHPADIAMAICGAQAQDLRHGRFAFRARCATITAADVDRARTEERSLVRTWAMRNTLHLVATEDVPWLMPLFEPRLAAFARARLAQLGLDTRAQDKALKAIAKALGTEGPLSRTQLRERLRSQGLDMKGYAGGHVIGLSVAMGIAVEGPGDGAVPLLVDARDWLGERPKHDRAAALAELARRYVRAFGPATEHDFAKWSGLPLRDLRVGLSAIAAELREVTVGKATLLASRRASRRARGGVVRLLPAWDTYLMGYPDRGFMATPRRWRRISDGGGGIAPAIAVDGMLEGTWSPGRRTETIGARARPFARPGPAVRAAIRAELADIARFEGSPDAWPR